MTRDEVLNASNEQLNKWVGVYVFGMEDKENKHISVCPNCGNTDLWIGENRSRCGDCNEWVYSWYKDYSGDILAAFELLGDRDITLHHHIFGDGLWYATIHKSEKSMAIYACAETAPLAICKVILLAVMKL